MTDRPDMPLYIVLRTCKIYNAYYLNTTVSRHVKNDGEKKIYIYTWIFLRQINKTSHINTKDTRRFFYCTNYPSILFLSFTHSLWSWSSLSKWKITDQIFHSTYTPQTRIVILMKKKLWSSPQPKATGSVQLCSSAFFTSNRINNVHLVTDLPCVPQPRIEISMQNLYMW